MVLRTGVDMTEISSLDELQPSIRERFIRRVFTAQEIEDAGNRAASLAGRFAAKEAVAKALGCGIGPVRWQDIEVVKGDQGQPLLALHGAAQRLSDELGVREWSLSISHSRAYAVAMAVGIGD